MVTGSCVCRRAGLTVGVSAGFARHPCRFKAIPVLAPFTHSLTACLAILNRTIFELSQHMLLGMCQIDVNSNIPRDSISLLVSSLPTSSVLLTDLILGFPSPHSRSQDNNPPHIFIMPEPLQAFYRQTASFSRRPLSQRLGGTSSIPLTCIVDFPYLLQAQPKSPAKAFPHFFLSKLLYLPPCCFFESISSLYRKYALLPFYPKSTVRPSGNRFHAYVHTDFTYSKLRYRG